MQTFLPYYQWPGRSLRWTSERIRMYILRVVYRRAIFIFFFLFFFFDGEIIFLAIFISISRYSWYVCMLLPITHIHLLLFLFRTLSFCRVNYYIVSKHDHAGFNKFHIYFSFMQYSLSMQISRSDGKRERRARGEFINLRRVDDIKSLKGTTKASMTVYQLPISTVTKIFADVSFVNYLCIRIEII